MKTIFTIVVQLILGLIATFGIYASGIGNGWELIAFPIVHAIVVCVVGWVIQRFMGGDSLSLSRLFVGALVVGAIGSAILLIPGAWGFQGVLIPLVGALLGYHIAAQF